MEGPRLVNLDEMPLVMELIGDVFGPCGDAFFSRPSPLGGLGFHVAVFAAGRPVSLAHLITDRLVCLGSPLKVAILSLVATSPGHRGQGLASLVLDYCLGLLRREEVRLLFATGNRDLYRRLGCYPAGILWTARLRQEEMPPAGQAAVRPAESADLTALWRLYAAEDPRLARGADDFRLHDVQSTTGCPGRRSESWLILRSGTPTAYVVVAAREDEPREGKIIEYAGDRRSLAGALRILAVRLDLARLELSVPHHDRQLLERLRAAGGVWQAGTLPGAVGILDPAGLWRDLLSALAGRLGEGTARRLCIYEGEEGAIGIRLGREALVLQDSERLVGLFFGAGAASWPGGTMPRNLDRVLSACLPLPLPLMQGLDADYPNTRTGS